MRNMNRIMTAVAGGLAISASCAFAQDWSQWRGSNRDGKASEFSAPKTWPKELNQKWKVTVGLGDATPALVGNKLFIFARQGDDEVIRCLDAANGKELWQEKYAAQAVSGPASQHSGPRSSPTVADGKIVTLGVVDAKAGENRRERRRWRRSRVEIGRGSDLQVVLHPSGKRQEGEQRRVRLGKAGHQHDVVVAFIEVSDNAVASPSVGHRLCRRLSDYSEAMSVVDIEKRLVLTAYARICGQVRHIASHAVHSIDTEQPGSACR